MDDSLFPDAQVLFHIALADGRVTSEALWATSLGADHYRLDSSPCCATGVSWEDVVLAPLHATQRMPFFQAVVAKSGNRTVRLCFAQPIVDGSASDGVLANLVKLGCTYRCADRYCASINVPPGVAMATIQSYLSRHSVSWEIADGAVDPEAATIDGTCPALSIQAA